MDGCRIGTETHEKAGRISSKIPYRITAYPLKFGRKALITAVSLVRDLSVYRECGRVCIYHILAIYLAA